MVGYSLLLILTLCYSDLPLKRVVGALGGASFILLAPVVALGHVARRWRCAWEVSRLDRDALLFLAACNGVGLVQLIVLAVRGEYAYLGESFVVKLMKMNLYYGLMYLAFRHARAVFRALRCDQLGLVFAVAGALQLLVMALEVTLIPNALSALHGSEVPYNRIRLLTPEASTSGTVVVILGGGTMALRTFLPGARHRCLAAWSAVGLVAAYSFLGRSKGYLLLIGVALAAAGMEYGWRRRSAGTMIGALLAGIAAVLLLAPVATSDLEGLIRDTSTVVTRGSLLLASARAFVDQPFGTGFGPHEYVLAGELDDATRQVANWLPFAANLVELDAYSTSSFGLFPKMALAELVLLGGVVGLWVAGSTSHHLYRASGSQVWLRLPLVFCLLALATYVGLAGKTDLAILAALIERLSSERAQTTSTACARGEAASARA